MKIIIKNKYRNQFKIKRLFYMVDYKNSIKIYMQTNINKISNNSKIHL